MAGIMVDRKMVIQVCDSSVNEWLRLAEDYEKKGLWGIMAWNELRRSWTFGSKKEKKCWEEAMWSSNTFQPFGTWEKKIALQRPAIFRLAYIYSVTPLYWQENWGNLPRATGHLEFEPASAWFQNLCSGLIWFMNLNIILYSFLPYVTSSALAMSLLPSKVIPWGYSEGSWQLQPHPGLG